MPRWLYTVLLSILLPFTPLKLLWRARKQPEYLAYWRERYGFYTQQPSKPIIWLHAVSVGETRAAEPLVRALLAAYPNHQILLTHTTPTGRQTSEQLFGNQVLRVYLPYDVPCAVKRFLTHFQPQFGMLMETELWFNVIAACKARHIALLLINARLSEKSASGYRKLGKLVREGLQGLTRIAAQTEADAARLQSLGARHVTVAGNLKFDVTPPSNAFSQGAALRSQLGQQRPVFLAASTRDGEEALILAALAKANIPELLTMIVPRHPQRFDAVAALIQPYDAHFMRRSALTENTLVPPHVRYVLGDSMGEMFTYYASCDIAFIGGSLLALGGQNLIEACRMGKPVLIGAHTFNFTQASEMAIAAGAAVRVQDADYLAQTLQSLMQQPAQRAQMALAAQQFSEGAAGATQTIMQIIKTQVVSQFEYNHWM